MRGWGIGQRPRTGHLMVSDIGQRASGPEEIGELGDEMNEKVGGCSA